MNAKDGVPLLGRPRGGVGGRSSLIDCSTAKILVDPAAFNNHPHTCNDELGTAPSVTKFHVYTVEDHTSSFSTLCSGKQWQLEIVCLAHEPTHDRTVEGLAAIDQMQLGQKAYFTRKDSHMNDHDTQVYTSDV